VRAGLRNRERDVRQQPAPVRALDDDSHKKAVLRLRLPLDLDAPLGVLGQIEHVRAVRAVDRDPAAARDVADHGITRYWLTALRIADHRVVHTLDADAAVALPDLADEALESRRRLGRHGLLARIQLLQDRCRTQVAPA